MKQLLILTSPYLNIKLLRYTAERCFERVEVITVSEFSEGTAQKFFKDKPKSGIIIVVHAGTFAGGYQSLLTLIKSVACETHYITDVPSDCPRDDQKKIQCHFLKSEEILDYTLSIIQKSRD